MVPSRTTTSMNRLFFNLAGGMRFPAGGAAVSGRTAVVAVALAGGSVAYLRSYPRAVPSKDPADTK